jgi:uncharacterized membrane protein YraQ (UPF0718 family)
MAKRNNKRLSGAWYFLILVMIGYLVLFLIKSELFFASLEYFLGILLKIIPVFIVVFVLMALVNYFISPKFVMKHLKEKGIKKWFFIVVGGILSSGPIYMWYPLLAELQKKGLSNGLVACFLYNRAIKLPLLPIAIFYFGLKYVILLTLVMIIFSILQGMLIDRIMKPRITSS